jgi:general secretion pathway protein A
LTLSDPFGVARGYEQYFGLVETPFGLTPNRRFLFESESHAAAIAQVTLAIRRREALMVVTGDIGSGKTLLGQTIQPVEPRTFVSVISNPRVSAADLLRQVLDDFGLEPDAAADISDTNQPVSAQLQQRLLAGLAELGAHAVIVIDEAQRLTEDALEQVRLLCSLDADTQKSLQVILIGRLELAAMLERPELHELAARVVRGHQLQPLHPHEIAPYVEHRLSVAQGETAVVSSAPNSVDGARRRVRFTAVALRSLPALTQGVPRAVNIICDRALDRACAENKAVVDAGCVLAAARDLKVVIPFELHLRSRWRVELVAAVVVIVGAGMFALRASGALPWTVATPHQAATLQHEPADAPVVEEATTVAPLPESESFSVAAATFRSENRAAAAASSLRLLDLPVFVRPVDGSHSVVVGPFASRQEALEAQAQVARVHLTNSRIISTAPTEGAFVHPPRPVATTGSKGQP